MTKSSTWPLRPDSREIELCSYTRGCRSGTRCSPRRSWMHRASPGPSSMRWCKHVRGCDGEQADHEETRNVNPEEIPLLVPDLPRAEKLLPYLHRIDRSRWYTNFGPLVGELEDKLSRLAGNER